MSVVRAAADGELETKRIRFYTLPPRGVEWPYLLVNCRNYRELFRRRFEHAILDAGVELFFDRLRLRGYPKWFLTMWKDLAKRMSKLFEGRLWVVIPDVPSDYHPSDWSNGLNVELTLKNVEDFIAVDGVDWVVVIQSRFDDLLSYYSSLKRTKEIVGDYPRIAIGTVCKTRNLRFIVEACKATRTWFPKSHVHAFGLTLTALPKVARYIDSWDSLAYAFPRGRGGRSCKTQAERVEYFSKYLERIDQHLRSAILSNEGRKVNRAALSWSALIPTDPDTGRPLHKTCVLRVLEQPDRQPHLWRTEEALDALERRPEARKLDLGQAKRRALALDGRLRGEDLEEW